MSAGERYKATAEELARVCKEAGRGPSEVTLVAVSKTVGVAQVASAIEAGARNFGENRPDQLIEKVNHFASTSQELSWHFIGNIQSRRIRDIVGRAALIHSLFEERHARKIDAVAAEKGIVQDVLIEVNVSGEESKSGLAPGEVRGMLEVCDGLEHVRACGLMTMAPAGDTQVARETFEGLADLQRALCADFPELTELSMGMTDDWPEAVQAGATFVRLGRVIFQ